MVAMVLAKVVTSWLDGKGSEKEIGKGVFLILFSQAAQGNLNDISWYIREA